MTANDIKEICTAYRQSKHPRKQITILAQLYDTSVRQIEDTLERNGFTVERRTPRNRNLKKMLRNSKTGETIRVCEFCHRFGLDREKVWNRIAYRKHIMQDGVIWDLIQITKD